jgi:hypothetical protein
LQILNSLKFVGKSKCSKNLFISDDESMISKLTLLYDLLVLQEDIMGEKCSQLQYSSYYKFIVFYLKKNYIKYNSNLG